MSPTAKKVLFFFTFSFFLLAFSLFTQSVYAQQPPAKPADPNPEAQPQAQQQAQQAAQQQAATTPGSSAAPAGTSANPQNGNVEIFSIVGKNPEPPSAANWNAFNQTTFTGNTIVNWLSCFGAAVPFGAEGCPQTIFKSKQTSNGIILVPSTMITYNGEGGGALGSSMGLIGLAFKNPPSSGVSYMARAVHSKFGLDPQPAYAQVGGSGAAVLSPVEGLWELSRNIAYLFFIFVFLGIGFMIMFRQKLNPQTVISVQSALPGIVVGLILVTFSYFIAGLIVDIAFWGSNVIGVLILSQITKGDTAQIAVEVRNILDNQGLIGMFSSLIFSADLWGAAGGLSDGVTSVIDSQLFAPSWMIGALIGGIATCFNPIGLAAMTTLGPLGVLGCAAIGTSAGGLGSGYIISGLIYLVLLIALLQAVIRLLFEIIMAYVQIVVFTILGPMMILFGSFPGNGEAISSWWRPLLANTLIFPAIFAVFLLARVLLVVSSTSTAAPPATLPLFGGAMASFIPTILTYGLILAAPAVPGYIRELLKAKTNGVFQQQISKNVGVGQKGVGLVGGTLGYSVGYRGLGGALQSRLEPMGGRLGRFSAKLRRKGWGN